MAAVVRARTKELRITQLELASRAGVSLATIQELVQGIPRRRQPRTIAAVSEALGWPTDRLSLVLRGCAFLNETSVVAGPTGDVDVDADAELRAIRKELAEITQRLDATERFAGQLQAQLIGLYGQSGRLMMSPES